MYLRCSVFEVCVVLQGGIGVNRKVLKWFGHVERMGDERLTKKVYKSEVSGEMG